MKQEHSESTTAPKGQMLYYNFDVLLCFYYKMMMSACYIIIVTS